MKKRKQSKELTRAENRYDAAMVAFEKAHDQLEKCRKELQKSNLAYIKAYNRSALLPPGHCR